MSLYSRFAACYEQVFPFREEVYGFLKNHAGESGSAVLDIGCGSGHYCGRFGGEGYKAIGIDLDEVMIAEAGRHYPDASFLCLDMRSVKSAGSGFNCIYSIGNGLAHLHRNDLLPFIESVHGMLVPGGRWIMQVMNWDALLALREYSFPEKPIKIAEDSAVFHRGYSSITTDSLSFSFALRYASGKELFAEKITLYPVTCRHYHHLHEVAGFRCSGQYSDFSMNPVRAVPGTGLVMVFEKC
ncbi:MAG: class I SAM-dependent methyltransferase [Chlorobiaceae bacterium]|nr:class I SAM-dependent methyltransferase [Chlorobiaceae bacterium]